ncbi:homolog of bacterial PANC [Striga asiatica]|uniref:Homolog of bacterial PANC n=1 Tax=Striga asiatica TaxID=4170 RepID=A0A5A7QQG3_STRAF|nr:homolog of bacterial PANC [Striga asiatica]
MPLEVPGLYALLVLVEQAEEVRVERAGPHGSPSARRDSGHDPLVEAAGVLKVRVAVAVGGPADLADYDGDVGVTVSAEGPHEGAGVVDWGGAGAVEEGVLDGEIWVGVERDERVDVDGEGGLGVAEEADDGEDEVVDVSAEVAAGRGADSIMDRAQFETLNDERVVDFERNGAM